VADGSKVPEINPLFDVATGTGEAFQTIFGHREPYVGLLGTASIKLQAAHVGARMASMASQGKHTRTLREVATDYDGVSSAAMNLAVRCSVTAVDLCARLLVQ